MAAWWKATKRFFGRISIRKSNKVGPSSEDRLRSDPDQADILEWEKEMKEKSKKGGWGLKRRKGNKSTEMKGEKESHAKGAIDIEIIESKEKVTPSISLSNVAKNESNEVKEYQTQKLEIEVGSNNNEAFRDLSEEKDDVSEIPSDYNDKKDSSQELECMDEESPKHPSIEKEDEFGKCEKSKSDEEVLDRKSEGLESQSCQGQKRSKKVPLANNSGSNEDFWDSLAEDYMYGESEAGEFSFRCEGDADDPKSEDSDLPEENSWAASAWIDTWVKKTLLWGSGSEPQSQSKDGKIAKADSGLNELSSNSFHLSEAGRLIDTGINTPDELSESERKVFLNSLDRLHIMEPNRQFSTIAKTEDWYSSSDEDTRALTTPSEDSEDSGLESEKVDGESLTAKTSEKENLIIQVIDPISQTLDPEHQLTPDLEETGNLSQKSSNFGKTSPTLTPKNEAALRVGFVQRCIRWISGKVRGTRSRRVAPAELFEPQVPSAPNSSTVKMEKEQSPSNSGKVKNHGHSSPRTSVQVRCQSKKVARQTLSHPCVPDGVKTKRRRKIKVKRHMPSDICQGQPENSSRSCKPEKVRTDERTPGHRKPRNVKMSPIPVGSASGISSYPRELATTQKQTSSCDSLYGEITLRKRKEKAGSQGWIRFPTQN